MGIKRAQRRGAAALDAPSGASGAMGMNARQTHARVQILV